MTFLNSCHVCRGLILWQIIISKVDNLSWIHRYLYREMTHAGENLLINYHENISRKTQAFLYIYRYTLSPLNRYIIKHEKIRSYKDSVMLTFISVHLTVKSSFSRFNWLQCFNTWFFFILNNFKILLKRVKTQHCSRISSLSSAEIKLSRDPVDKV